MTGVGGLPKRLTGNAVAVLHGVSPSTVAAACRDRSLRGEKVGPVWSIRRDDALAWLPRAPGRPRKDRKPSDAAH